LRASGSAGILPAAVGILSVAFETQRKAQNANLAFDAVRQNAG
jgi:hypothetical protein